MLLAEMAKDMSSRCYVYEADGVDFSSSFEWRSLQTFINVLRTTRTHERGK